MDHRQKKRTCIHTKRDVQKKEVDLGKEREISCTSIETQIQTKKTHIHTRNSAEVILYICLYTCVCVSVCFYTYMYIHI